MALAVAAVVLGLLFLYFVWETARDQELDIPYSATYTPAETVLETELNIEAPSHSIWETLISLRDYHLWFPWVRRVRVTNQSAERWAHRHSFQHFTPEVGRRFQIRCLPFSPLTSCRFVAINPHDRLSMEMRFLPLVREIVTFTLKPYANVVQVQYRSVSPSLLGFASQALFASRGKKVLHNLQAHLPELPPVEEAPAAEEETPKEVQKSDEEALIQKAVAQALEGNMDAINNISDRVLRARAKAAHIKAKRTGQVPAVPENATAVETEPPSTPPVEKTAPAGEEPSRPVGAGGSDEDTLILEAVTQALEGNMDVINNISDRVLRARAKSAYIKAKRAKSSD